MEILISNNTDPKATKEGLLVVVTTSGDKISRRTKTVIYEKLSDEEKDIVDKFRSLIKLQIA